MSYAAKAKIAALLGNLGFRVERDGDDLFAYEPKGHVQDKKGVRHPRYERVAIRTMADARALKKRADS